MAIHIKSAAVEQLTRELAQATGESLTTAVTIAVRERLDRVRAGATAPSAEQRAERLLELGELIAARLTGPFATADHGDLLYDDRALPA